MQRIEPRVASRTGDDVALPPAGRTTPVWLSQVFSGVGLGLTAILLSLVFWPGSIDADTLGELQEVATGKYTDWHIPVLEALWRIPYLLGIRGPGWLLPVGLFTLLAGFYLILRCRLSRPVSTVLAIACCLFPPVLTWAVHVGADAWFAASIITSFGLAARCFRTKGWSRTISVVGSVWFAAIALAARHNAVPAVLVVMIVLSALALDGVDVRYRKLTVFALGAIATLGLYVVEAGVQWATGTESTHPAQSAMVYDLAQLSKEEHRVLLPRSVDPGQSLSALEAGTTVRQIDGLLFVADPPVRFPVEGATYSDLKSAWERAILHNPAGYLSERLRLGLWMLSIGHPSYWLFSPPHSFAQYSPKYHTIDNWGYDYLSVFTFGPGSETGDQLYDGWIYAAISVLGAVILLRRRATERVVGAMCVALLIYLFVLEFSGPGELYRYVYPLVAAGTVVAVVLLSYPVEALVSRVSADWSDRSTERQQGARRMTSNRSDGAHGIL
jgi:hypothetical protein